MLNLPRIFLILEHFLSTITIKKKNTINIKAQDYLRYTPAK